MTARLRLVGTSPENMRVPIAEVGRRGRLALTFVLQNGRTVLEHAYCETPFKITRVLNSRLPAAHLILMQCTAGLFGGDEVECSIRITGGARVVLTQQSATRIHPSQDRQAIQNLRLFVESGAELEFNQEPVIPFADSSLKQSTHIEVQPGGRLVFWEGLMAGRVGRGERWQFKELSSETILRVNNRPAFLDRYLLMPDGSESGPFSMRNNSYFGTGLYVGEQAEVFAARLHDALPEAGIDTTSSGVVLTRVVSATGPEFHRSRETFCRLASNCRRGQ